MEKEREFLQLLKETQRLHAQNCVEGAPDELVLERQNAHLSHTKKREGESHLAPPSPAEGGMKTRTETEAWESEASIPQME